MTNLSSEIHVACSADQRYAPHCAAMLHSLLEHCADTFVHVHFLMGPGVPQSVIDGLAQLVKPPNAALHVLRVTQEQDRELVALGNIPGAQWYRVLLPELLPELDRVLYLDSDLIVRSSLAPLWATELGDAALAAMTNPFPLRIAEYPTEHLGLSNAREYFNTGVMLMNLARLRRTGEIGLVKAYAEKRRGELRWPEQDALNVVLGAHRVPIAPRWNVLNTVIRGMHAFPVMSTEEILEARRDPAIVHFEGNASRRPWHYLSDHPYRGLYHRHLRETPWPEGAPEGRTFANILRKYYRRWRGYWTTLWRPKTP